MTSEKVTYPLAGALGLAVGAGLMYLLDPDRGRKRRSRLQDKAARASRKAGQLLDVAAKDFRNRRSGILAKARSLFRDEHAIPDAKLEARVRSALGRAISHPHAIHVDAQDGHITLSGSILAAAADRVGALIRKVPGVRHVENRLQVQEADSGHPALQGQEERSHPAWTPAGRLLAGALGGGLTIYGVSSSNRLTRTAATTMGVGLLASSVTNRGR